MIRNHTSHSNHRRSPRARLMLMATLLVGTLAIDGLSRELHAQRDETLVGNRGTQFGGFGGPVVKITSVAGTNATISGGRGGFIVNRRFVIGGGGYGLVNENIRTGYRFSNGAEPTLGFGYGGLEFEYITQPTRLVHATFGTLLGGGEAFYEDTQTQGGTTSTQRISTNVFVLEPQIMAELNVTRWFRPGIGVTYRYVSGTDLPGLADSDLSGVAGLLTFKFGSF